MNKLGGSVFGQGEVEALLPLPPLWGTFREGVRHQSYRWIEIDRYEDGGMIQKTNVRQHGMKVERQYLWHEILLQENDTLKQNI